MKMTTQNTKLGEDTYIKVNHAGAQVVFEMYIHNHKLSFNPHN
jgi:hypothetical protein